MTGSRTSFVAALVALAAAAFFSDVQDLLLPRVAAAHVHGGVISDQDEGVHDAVGPRLHRRRRSLTLEAKEKEAFRRDRLDRQQYRRRWEVEGTRKGGLSQWLDPKTVTLRAEEADDGEEVATVPGDIPKLLGLFDNPFIPVIPAPHDSYGNGTTAPAVNPYSIGNVLLTQPFFGPKFFTFLYVAERDEFIAMYNVEELGWSKGNVRVRTDGNVLTYALRNHFPERFQGTAGESSDLAFLISVGDSVTFHPSTCLNPENRERCQVELYAPIFVFGSAFADRCVLPSQIAMPMPPRPHIPCFRQWQLSQTVCQDLRPRDGDSGVGLVFEEHVGVGWDDLIPTIIWRGTDYASFLQQIFKDLRQPDYALDVEPKINEYDEDPAVVISALYGVWDILLPRWKGVLLTAEAELEALTRNDGSVPWANIKFVSHIVDGEKLPCSKSPFYREWNLRGIPAYGKSADLNRHARYKYHIDLGGYGGTTWTGTIHKLSMPGVLFHHVTPTKDWIHDLLEPWEHYIPVATDLLDLRERFEWAEAHPVEARQISDNASAFAKWIGTPEGFEELYHLYFVDNLAAVIDAYRPPEVVFGSKGAATAQLLSAISNVEEVMRCSGLVRSSCVMVGRAAQDSKGEGGDKVEEEEEEEEVDRKKR